MALHLYDPLAPDFYDPASARAERDRATEHAREGIASFSAATAYVLAGHADQARPLAERALSWDQWAVRARELLAGLPARR